MPNKKLTMRSIAAATAAATLVTTVPATSSAQALPSPEQIQAMTAAAVLVIGAAAAASSQEANGAGGLDTSSLSTLGGGSTGGGTTEPGGGTTNPGTATKYLDELRAVTGNLGNKSVKVNGVTYPRSVTGWLTEGRGAEYDLNREYSRFKATIGMTDASDSRSDYTFQVFVDDVPRGEWRMGIGKSVPIDIDVRGGLRLRLVVKRNSNTNDNSSGYAWGDARLTK